MSPEVQELWERALRALQTAEDLVDRDPDASSSRAYYAAFYAVSALLALDGQSYSKHTAVERAVHRDYVKPGRFSVEVGAAFPGWPICDPPLTTEEASTQRQEMLARPSRRPS
ncbi:MAG: HEPN domain-containing protein [Thermoanaerobaculia bacterium]